MVTGSSINRIMDLEGFWRDLVSDDGICVVDSQQRILFWSKSAYLILGHPPEAVVGRSCYEVVGGRDARNFQFCRRNCPTIVNARRGRPTPNYDVICASSGGQLKWVNISTAVFRNRDSTLGVMHMFRDVSHRRHIEESAQRVAAKLRQVIEEEINPSVCSEEPRCPPLPKLSPREMETLRLLSCGLSTKDIATSLRVRPLTARNHVSRLLLKLGAENRLQAVLFASRHRLI